MKHEFLNGDAMKEIIIDNSINLFIMWPPYLGMDTSRYGFSKQINDINDTVIFSKKLAKIAKNCYKALKDGGSLIYIIPNDDPSLFYNTVKYLKKKTKLQYNGTMIWDYYDETMIDRSKINGSYCLVLWLSKGAPKVNNDYLTNNNNAIIKYPLKPGYLNDKYGAMGNVNDALPEPVAKHLIQLFTNEGDTVSNVMGGTGTVTVVAEMLERDSIYNDISYVQLTIAKRRLEDYIAEKKKSNIKSK